MGKNNRLSLIHGAKKPPSFNSARWKSGYNPDIPFASEKISSINSKDILYPIPRTQCRPVILQVTAATTPTKTEFKRLFNFNKAKLSQKTCKRASHPLKLVTPSMTTSSRPSKQLHDKIYHEMPEELYTLLQ